jgi:hypothetical protein
LITVGVLGQAQPAQAHNICVALGDRGVACNRLTRSDHTRSWIDGCDRRADGYRVRAWYSLSVVGGDYAGSWDPNGANAGCANDLTSPNFNFYRQRICVEVVGCSGWGYHP